MHAKPIPIKRISELLRYEPDTGHFFWIKTVTGHIKQGARVGHRHEPYLAVGIDGRTFPLHRLAWVLHHGVQQVGQIDHINGDQHDNRIANLRDVPKFWNSQNRHGPNRNNTLGIKGVTSRGKGFVAYISIDGKPTYLGKFDTSAAASEAYMLAKRQHHKGCTI